MEEKLYFKPEASKKQKKEKKDHKFLKLFFFLLFLLIIILIIIWLLRGTKTVSGQYPENIKTESLECIANDLDYDKITSTNLDNEEIKLNAIFSGTEQFSSLNLTYSLTYDNNIEAINAEAVSHAEFNLALATLSLPQESFNNKFTILDNKLIVSLYFSSSDINEYSKSYILLDPNENPVSLIDYKKIYEKKGFNCTSTAK